MKICILGSTGLLGQALMKEGHARGVDVVGVARENADFNLDITKDEKLTDFILEKHFDVVINTVAIVNHKMCDEDTKLAYDVNARPSALLTQIKSDCNYKYIFISTDGYFSEDKDEKHDEKAKVYLLNEYAKTKFAGEMFTLINSNSLVIRTNIIGFRRGMQPTFLEWVINALRNKDKMTLFEDYFTSSITVAQFSVALFDLLPKNPCGILNLASSEVYSKAMFIQELARRFKFSLENTTVGTVSLLSSKRANSLGLDVSRAERILGYSLPGLSEVLTQIKKEYENV